MDGERVIGLGKSRAWWRMVLLVAIAAALTVALPATPAVADFGDIGYQDFSYAGTSTPSTPTGTKRAESVLWFNDGIWWANMWDTVSQDYHIFKLDPGTQTWSDTGTTLDPRISSHADVLWDGTHLYVAAHLFVNDEVAALPGFQSRLYRYSYDSGTQTYSLDSGFPVLINTEKTETLVIAKDSTGQLWATWQQDNQIYVNSTQGDDLTWGTPFALPANKSSVTVDDNSSVIAFGGNKIGVMWSNETPGSDGFYFAFHKDTDADTTWQATTTVIHGERIADDHMNLKALSDGRVLAAVKTGNIDPSLPLTMLLVRDPGGAWHSYTISTQGDCPNRPTVLVDETNDIVHILETAPAPPNFSCNSTGGAIYEKTAPLSQLAFAPGYGTPVIVDADSAALHNVSSTKQNLNTITGLVGLAINAATKFYWHTFESLPPSPKPDADFTGTPTSGTAPLTVKFTDTSTNNPTNWAWTFGDGGTSSSQNPSHIYKNPGTYTVSLKATNSFGSNTETKVGYITVNPPPPDFTLVASPLSRDVPAGKATDFDVTLNPIGGFSGSVDLSVSGLPAATAATFSKDPVPLPPKTTVKMHVVTSRTTALGPYTLTITGVSGTSSHSASVTLNVKKP